MNIGYRSNKLEKQCVSAARAWGDKIGKKVLLRLAELSAYETLKDVPVTPPQRCHMVDKDNLTFAVDLTRNYRLIFYPSQPYDYEEGLGLIKTSVKSVIVDSVEDYH